MRRFFADIKKFWNYVTYSARSELKAEVAGSFLSWLWWFLDPLLYMLVYSFIAILIFNSPEDHFPVFVFLGMNCWQFFSKTVKASVRLVLSNKNVVTKVYIPKHMFILEKMGVYGFKMLVSFGLTAAFLIGEAILNAVWGIGKPVTIGFEILWVIPLLAVLFLVTFAVSLFMTHFGVFVEDLTNVITVALQLGFYVSGVFYSLETRLANASLELFGLGNEFWTLLGKVLVSCNPVALVMSDMRYAVLGNGDGIHYVALLVWTVIAALVAILGIKVIYKFENSYVKII